MIRIHHLSDSRSQKTVWLAEELGIEYELVNYQRMENLRAPSDMKALHPMSSAPMLEVDGHFYPESGAIAMYLLNRFDDHKLAPNSDSQGFADYLYWMHFGIASGMQAIMYKVRAPGHGLVGSAYDEAANAELDKTMDFLDGALKECDYLLGENFSAADIQVSFVPELANALGRLGDCPNTRAWLTRLYNRPAFKKSLTVGAGYRHFVDS